MAGGEIVLSTAKSRSMLGAKLRCISDLSNADDFRSSPDCVAKVFLGDDQNFSGLLMRFAREDTRDRIVSHKTTTELRMSATEYCSGGAG
jgi:hypothetical protein